MATQPQPVERAPWNPVHIPVLPDVENQMARETQRQSDLQGAAQTRSTDGVYNVGKAQFAPQPGQAKIGYGAVKQRITMRPDTEHHDIPIRQRRTEIKYWDCDG